MSASTAEVQHDGEIGSRLAIRAPVSLLGLWEEGGMGRVSQSSGRHPCWWVFCKGSPAPSASATPVPSHADLVLCFLLPA